MKLKNLVVWATVLSLGSCICYCVASGDLGVGADPGGPAIASGAEAGVRPAARQVSWQQREVEVLVHFGMNTFTGREWGVGAERPEQFNPSALDCDQWVEAARSIGARGIVLVAKHHDGFCLWPSKVTEHSVKNSPWRNGKGDVVKEVSDACRRGGLAFGVYLSPGDLHEPTFGRRSKLYNDFYCAQLRELLTGYGEVSQVFMDGAELPGRQQGYDFPLYYQVVRELQSNAVISMRGPDVRWVGNEEGMARESEWSVIPLSKPPETAEWRNLMETDLGSAAQLRGAAYLHWYPAVADVSLRQGWFWRPGQDHTIKSVKDLVRIYEGSVGRNAGLQLNLSPDRNGLIPEADVQRLKEFGAALRERFSTNLLEGVAVQWNGSLGEENAPLTGTSMLPKPGLVRYVQLREDITQGQRVEEFEVLITTRGGEVQSLKGTTIGWKRLVKAEVPHAAEVAVRILRSRAEPKVTFQAY